MSDQKWEREREEVGVKACTFFYLLYHQSLTLSIVYMSCSVIRGNPKGIAKEKTDPQSGGWELQQQQQY